MLCISITYIPTTEGWLYLMESFFSTLKSEFVHHTRFQSRAQARRELFEFIEIYYREIFIPSRLPFPTSL
jgi:putative transposase